jgi:hypothetical protein
MDTSKIDIPTHALERFESIIEKWNANWLKVIIRAPVDSNQMYLEVGKLQAAEKILQEVKDNFRPL